MKNKGLVGIIVVIFLVAVGYFVFGGKTALFKGSFGPVPRPAGECAEDDAACWEARIAKLEGEINDRKVWIHEAKERVIALDSSVDEKKELMQAQLALVNSSMAKVNLLKKKQAVAKRALDAARRRGNRRAIEQAQAALGTIEAQLAEALQKLENAKQRLEEMKQELKALQERLDKELADIERWKNDIENFEEELQNARASLEEAQQQAATSARNECRNIRYQQLAGWEMSEEEQNLIEQCESAFADEMHWWGLVICEPLRQWELEGRITPGTRNFLNSCRRAYPEHMNQEVNPELCGQWNAWVREETLTANTTPHDSAVLFAYNFCRSIYPESIGGRLGACITIQPEREIPPYNADWSGEGYAKLNVAVFPQDRDALRAISDRCLNRNHAEWARNLPFGYGSEFQSLAREYCYANPNTEADAKFVLYQLGGAAVEETAGCVEDAPGICHVVCDAEGNVANVVREREPVLNPE